jgi:hypothetical protein
VPFKHLLARSFPRKSWFSFAYLGEPEKPEFELKQNSGHFERTFIGKTWKVGNV